MTLDQIREIIRVLTLQEAVLPNMLVVRGLNANQLREILLLAQSQLCELESRADSQPNNPS